MKIESLVIHGGIDGDERTGAVNVPILNFNLQTRSIWGKFRI